MELTKYKIGELIELTNEKNANGLYGEDDAIGVNIDKIIMPMRGNLEKKDFSNFHLVPPRHFAYNPRGSRKLGIGFNDTEKTFIITFNDNVFRIKETAKKKILDTYLFMYLCRKEWDRYAEFISWGSSTEVFDWNIFCEEEIFLPPIQIQQKYVDVYNAMLENQKSYEHGLDDLKLSFEALLDEYKHKVEKMPIGSLLKEVDNRNMNGLIKNVQGINITKQFMPSVANTNGVDLSKYKVVNKGQFVFSGMQTGRDKCIRIALFDKVEPIIISPAYAVLEIIDADVLAEYVMMWFLRKEVDRLGWFMSDGSIRTNLDMDCFYEIEIPVPDINVQKSIVEIYNAFYICTIQKFCDREDDKIGLINDRQNIICFSDEAHRTQLEHSKKIQFSKDADENMKAMVSKPYAKVLKEAFPHATFVGFTGTPIAETYQTFGDEIDRYTMDQAVADGLTVSIKYHPRIAKVLLDNKKVKEIENYYKKCVDDGATYEDIEASKKAMSSMEIILGEPSRLERLATDIHNHYVASCAGDPDRIQKAMVVCSNRKIAYALLQKFKDKYPEWFEEKKSLDGVSVTEEELKELKPMPFMAMVSSVGSNDEKDMYDYLGGVKNDKRSEELDAAFKQEKSNFSIVIVVDMWITGFDVPCLTYLYNDKPLKKHLLIQTISRVNRKYPGKEYGMVIDYIGIRDNMREAMKVYGGDTSVAPTSDDVEQATSVFREELEVLKNMFTGYDLSPFLNPECDPIERYRLLAKAAEYVFVSTEELQSEGNKGVQKVSFKTYFLKTVKRMREAFDICQPSGYLGEEESALAQCFMAIAGFVRKMSGTSEVDTDTMNRAVSKMVEEALKYNQVESVLESGEEEDIFSPEYFEKLSDVKMPATKLELLVKMLRKQIKEYGKVNQLAAKSFQEMLEKTIAEYHERRKHLTAEEVGEAQEGINEIFK